jgi:1-acyl-sn-glycerol-3-phosphate acyltransferase
MSTYEGLAVEAKQANAQSAPSARDATHRLPFVDGVYRTPPRKVSLLARRFPSTLFYPKLFAAVFRAGAKAKRGAYGDCDWCATSRAVMRTLEKVGVRFEITGVEHLERVGGPCLIVANHMGTLETAVLPTIIQPILHVTFIVKQSLIDYPVFKYVMRSRDPIALTQTDPRADFKTTLVEGAARLARGISIVVFPEGRRANAFDPAKFNTIGVKLAHRAGVPIVPLALKTDAWALGNRYLSDFGRINPAKPVHFAFGEPLRVHGRGVDENRAIIEFIQQKLEFWEQADQQ